MRYVKSLLASLALATSVLVPVALAAPASAAGSLGSCYPWSSYSMPGHGGGYCQGTGPDWTYRGYVRCNNGYSYTSASSRWAGDTRGLSATCPSGVTAWTGGVRVYYKAALQYTFTVRT